MYPVLLEGLFPV